MRYLRTDHGDGAGTTHTHVSRDGNEDLYARYPHQGDCTGTLCTACGCCCHCKDDGHCEGTSGCWDQACGCWEAS
jgi:hypothetical protein